MEVNPNAPGVSFSVFRFQLLEDGRYEKAEGSRKAPSAFPKTKIYSAVRTAAHRKRHSGMSFS